MTGTIKKICFGIVLLLVTVWGIQISVSVADSRTVSGDYVPKPVEICGDTSLLSRYHFLNRTSNQIVDKDSTLTGFFTQLDLLQRDSGDFFDSPHTVSILHIGDSHIQAGELTRTVRCQLQRSFGNAGRGLIVPLKLASSNEPVDYRITSSNTWQNSKCIQKNIEFRPGIGGIALATHQNQIQFTLQTLKKDSMMDYRFNTIRVFHHESAPLLEEPESLSIGISCPDTTLNYMTDIFLMDCVDSLTLTGLITDERYNTPIFYGFSLENAQPGILYHSVGVNGACCSHYLNTGLIEQSVGLHPDLIVISLGTNEAASSRFDKDVFRNAMDALIKQLKKVNPESVFLLVTPMENYRRAYVRGRRTYVLNKNLGVLRQMICEYAESNHLAYWDMYSACGGEGAAESWFKQGLMARDRIHFTSEGYQLQGMLMYEAFINSYNRNLTNRVAAN